MRTDPGSVITYSWAAHGISRTIGGPYDRDLPRGPMVWSGTQGGRHGRQDAERPTGWGPLSDKACGGARDNANGAAAPT